MRIDPADVLRLLDLTGVFMTAILGGRIARQERLDPIGLMTLAVISSLGGGMIRDVLLRIGVVSALADPAYLLTALAGAGVSYIGGYAPVWRRLWPLVDAVALGVWAAAGAQKSLAFGLDWLPAMLLGVVTAVGGGVIRDVLLRRVPSVLGGNTLYATSALAAGGLTVFFSLVLHLDVLGQLIAAGVGAVLTLLAAWRGWTLPDVDEWTPGLAVERAGRSIVRHGRGHLPPRRTGATSAGRRVKRIGGRSGGRGARPWIRRR